MIEQHLEYLEKCQNVYSEYCLKKITAVSSELLKWSTFSSLKEGIVKTSMQVMINHYQGRLGAIWTRYNAEKSAAFEEYHKRNG